MHPLILASILGLASASEPEPEPEPELDPEEVHRLQEALRERLAQVKARYEAGLRARRPRIPVVVYSPHDREEVRLELHGVPRVGEELELQEGRWLVDLVVWYPDHVEIRTRNAT